ncbi:hypothetical protein EVAR_60540_1 [Eumeta japonica]|uniref:Uncharacterized protein n=1 Tax=Eumeta variegata TaxID=151549 RepID=A0A4C1YU92_EUMVA|nr:hypothetical protein EVAR_60540_1 [Eumeta japonica]
MPNRFESRPKVSDESPPAPDFVTSSLSSFEHIQGQQRRFQAQWRVPNWKTRYLYTEQEFLTTAIGRKKPARCSKRIAEYADAKLTHVARLGADLVPAAAKPAYFIRLYRSQAHESCARATNTDTGIYMRRAPPILYELNIFRIKLSSLSPDLAFSDRLRPAGDRSGKIRYCRIDAEE